MIDEKRITEARTNFCQYVNNRQVKWTGGIHCMHQHHQMLLTRKDSAYRYLIDCGIFSV